MDSKLISTCQLRKKNLYSIKGHSTRIRTLFGATFRILLELWYVVIVSDISTYLEGSFKILKNGGSHSCLKYSVNLFFLINYNCWTKKLIKIHFWVLTVETYEDLIKIISLKRKQLFDHLFSSCSKRFQKVSDFAWNGPKSHYFTPADYILGTKAWIFRRVSVCSSPEDSATFNYLGVHVWPMPRSYADAFKTYGLLLPTRGNFIRMYTRLKSSMWDPDPRNPQSHPNGLPCRPSVHTPHNFPPGILFQSLRSSSPLAVRDTSCFMQTKFLLFSNTWVCHVYELWKKLTILNGRYLSRRYFA